MARLSAVFWLVIFPSVAQSGTPQFSSLTSRQGLSDNNINAFVQDEFGFLWIATEAGLNRYDGYGVETFTHGKYPEVLPDDEIVTMLLGPEHSLWMGTESGGLILYDIATHRFRRIGYAENGTRTLDGRQLSSNTVHALALRGDRLFVGTEGGGLNVVDLMQESVAYYFVERGVSTSLCHNEIKVMHMAKNGILWLGTVDGLTRLDPETMLFQCYKRTPDDPHSLSNNEVVAIVEDKFGNLWLGTEGGGVNYLDVEQETFYRYVHDPSAPNSLSHNEVQAMLLDSSGQLWVGTVNGLNRLDADKNEFESYFYRANSQGSINSNVISALYQDEGGVIWIGTEGGGVNKWRPAALSLATESAPVEDLWSGHRISAIFRDAQDTLWVGSENLGLFATQLDGLQEQYDCQSLPCGNVEQLEVTAITGNRDGVWFGTDGGGLLKFTFATQTFSLEALPVLPELAQWAVTSLHLAMDGTLWIGTENSLIVKHEPKTGAFVLIPLTPLLELDAEFGNEVQCMHQDSNQTLWIGTEEYGAIRYEQQTGTMRLINKETKALLGLSNNSVNTIIEDKVGRIWLATNLGVNLYTPETNSMAQIYVEDGLQSNTVMSAILDDEGDVWLATNKGLNRIQANSLVISSYDSDDGLSSEHFGRHAVFKDGQGRLYFGGNKGIDVIEPKNVTKNLHPPKVAITRLSLFDITQRLPESRVLSRPIYSTRRFLLDHTQTVFSLGFSALDFSAPDKHQYAYQLLGFDPRWQFVGTQRIAAYTNLPAGDYEFQVKGTNNDGVWSEPAVLQIHIRAAPWKTPIAYTLYVMLLVSLGYFIVAFRIRRERAAFELRREREEKQRLKESFEMEQRFTANVAHELRTPLAELINMSEVALMWPDAPEVKAGFYQDVLDSATQMHQVVNNLLALARCERGLVQLKYTRVILAEEIRSAWERHAALWQAKGVTFLLTGSEHWEVRTSQAELALILNNILSNAIDYAPEGTEIRVSLAQASGQIQCRNQMALPLTKGELALMFQRLWRKDVSRSSERHSGLGMSLIRAYAELLGLEVNVEIVEADFIISLRF